MMIQATVEELAQAHLDLFTANQARLFLHVVRLLARGTLVSLGQLAEASHFTRERSRRCSEGPRSSLIEKGIWQH